MLHEIRNSMIMKIKLLASAKEIVGEKDEMILEFIKGTIVTVTNLRER